MDTKRKNCLRAKRKDEKGVKLPPIESTKDDDIKTVLDIDPEFYSLVRGRPIRPNTSYLKYKQDVKEVAMKRAVRGFLEDEIIRIDREMEEEKNIYEIASKQFENSGRSFDKFLAYDNDKTIVIMKKSDNLARELANHTEQYKKVSFEMASLKAKLQYLDETLLIFLSLENFLHNASPILWQEKNNIKLNVEHKEIITIENDIFKIIDIDEIKKRLGKLATPILYFENPKQLIDVFEYSEKQNLDYLLVTGEVNLEKKKFVKTKDTMKNLLFEELNEIQKKVNAIEDTIKWNEERVIELKEIYFKILEDKIKDIVSSKLTLELFICVEFAYEQLMAPNETKQGTLDMAIAIEVEYDNLMLKLSTCDLNLVKQIEKEVYESSEREIKQAKIASRLLKDVDKLNRRLKASFEPPRRKELHVTKDM